MTSEIKVDTISENTSANGVTIDGLTIKDGNIIGDVALAGTTPTFTIGDAGAEDAALIFDGNAVDYYIALDDSADDLVIGTGSTIGSNAKMVINSDGKILIGDVASHTADLFQIETPASGGGHGIQIRRNDANTDQQIGTISFGNNTDTDLAQILVRTDNDSNSGDSGALTFKTQPTGGASTERMRIDSTGKVGIGETAPLCPAGGLHIKSGDSGQGTANPHADELVVEGSANSGINILSGNNDYGSVFFGDNGDSNAGEITYNHASNYMAFATSGTERFRISSNGLAIGGTGDANSLDDYEEGTFTYAINGSNSGNLVLRSGYARGEYVKVGNVVHIDLRFETSDDNSISGNLQWTLPFTKANPNANDAGNSVSVGYIRDNSLGTNARTGVYLVGQSEAYAQLLFSREGAANSTVELATDANTDGVMEGVISITYRTT